MKDPDSTTPTNAALHAADTTFPKVLEDGNTFLSNAVQDGNFETVLALLQSGADANVPRANGDTPFIISIYTSNPEIASILIKYGADVNATTKGWTNLMVATYMEEAEIVKTLLEHGAEVDAKDSNGWTSLLLAANKQSFNIVSLLIDYGADVDAKNDAGWSALKMASGQCYEPMVELLIENGANLDQLWGPMAQKWLPEIRQRKKRTVELMIGIGIAALMRKQRW